MRNVLGFAILGILAVASAARTEMVPVRSITVTGMAERKVIPDEAHISVTLGATQMKMADAKATHDAKLKKLYAIASKNGIPEKNLRTESSSVQPYYSYSDGKQIFKGYRVSTSIDMKLSDATKLGAIVEQIMASGLEEQNQQEYGQLLSTSYTLSNPDKLRDELLAEAIRNARSKADNMAEAADASVARVYQISEGETPNYAPRPMPIMMAMKADAAMGAARESVSPPMGEQDVRSTVTVTFELKN